ncbi:DUF7673 family protein [Cupriavidus necator]
MSTCWRPPSATAAKPARWLADLYNGQDFPFDLTELRTLDTDLFEHCLAVLRLHREPEVEIHQYFPDGQARWQRLIAKWRLNPSTPAEPPPALGGPGCRRTIWAMATLPAIATCRCPSALTAIACAGHRSSCA